MISEELLIAKTWWEQSKFHMQVDICSHKQLRVIGRIWNLLSFRRNNWLYSINHSIIILITSRATLRWTGAISGFAWCTVLRTYERCCDDLFQKTKNVTLWGGERRIRYQAGDNCSEIYSYTSSGYKHQSDEALRAIAIGTTIKNMETIN